MERIKSITHNGKTVIIVDLSKAQPSETILVIPEAIKLIATSKPKSALVLTDVGDANYNREVAEAIKDFVSQNTPYVKASAVVGADGVRLVLLQTVIFLSRRELKSFDTREKALDWLVSV